MKEIAENDFNLNITRYVSISKEEEEIDLLAVAEQLKECDKKIESSQKKLNEYLKELGLPLI